jgi:hypothetical protein
MTISKAAQNYSFGSVFAEHKIGPYEVWEYHPRKRDGSFVTREIDFETTHYHGLIDGKDTSTSWESLDAALAGMIVMRSLGPNCRAIDECFIAGIEAMAKED